LPQYRPPFWLGGGLLLLSLFTLVGGGGVFCLALDMSLAGSGNVEDALLVVALLGGVGLAGLITAAVLMGKYNRDLPRIHALQQLGKLLSLEYRTHITFDELEPFFGLPLFAFAFSKDLRGGFSLHGRIDGQEVWMFDLVYPGTIRTPEGLCLPHSAAQTLVLFPVPAESPTIQHGPKGSHPEGVCLHEAVQPGVVFPVARDLPDFRLGPVNSDWERQIPAGPVPLDVGDWALDINEEGEPTTRVFSKDVAEVRQLVSPACLAELGNLAGWIVECRSGDLLVYRFGATAPAAEVQAYLQRALAIRRALTRPDGLDVPAAQAWSGPLRAHRP
jgi:hypothetical protein